MDKPIKNILYKHFKFPKSIEFKDLKRISESSFLLCLKCYSVEGIIPSVYDINLYFKDDDVKATIKNDKPVFYNTNIDLKEFEDEEDKKNKNNVNFFIKLLSNISHFASNFSNINITDIREDSYKIKCIKKYSFKLNNNSKDIIESINNEITLYYIKEYIEQNLSSSYEGDLEIFLKLFENTNCKVAFSVDELFELFLNLNTEREVVFSKEFENAMNFRTQKELEYTIELLKINYSF